jgi:hypothetical protein
MANYLLAYKGGGMAESEADREAAMAAWGGWLGGLGEALVDAGNPFGPSKSLASDGAASDGGAAGLTGYSILTADTLAAATELARGCPVFAAGGSVEIYETVPVM